MKLETIVWTVMPRGISSAGKLQLSLYASPQLETDQGLPRPALGQFTNWVDWPKIVNAMTFKVQFYPGPLVNATVVTDTPPDSSLWKQIFNNKTYVAPYQFQKMDNRLIFSYPVSNVHSFLKGLYSAAAVTNPNSFPTKLALWELGQLSKISFFQNRATDVAGGNSQLHNELIKLMQTHYEKLNGNKPLNAVPPSAPNPTMDFYQVTNFFTPQSKALPAKPYKNQYGRTKSLGGNYQRLTDAQLKNPYGAPRTDQYDLDFHQVISSFGDYPKLMRMLGLVIDLEVDMQPTIVSSSSTSGLPAVQIVTQYGAGVASPLPTETRPKVVYELSPSNFIAKPRPNEPDLTDVGLLRLRDQNALKQNVYEIVQVDVDGTALKLMSTAYNLVQSTVHRTVDSPEYSSLPAMRSAGFSIARNGNALALAGEFARQDTLVASGGSTPTMYAEDVLRGYRMDVFDLKTHEWHSLYDRIGHYDFGNSITRDIEDEGFTQLATTSAADGSSTDLFLHENFVKWKGWSLAVRRPGTVMDNSGNAQDPGTLNAQNPNYAFHPTFKLPGGITSGGNIVKGKLPGLRFGQRYRLRIRSVNLAGNSTPDTVLNPTDFSAATDPMMYTRFEPIANPVVVLHDDLASYKPPFDWQNNPTNGGGPAITSPGESLEQLVIRSFNSTVAENTTATQETTTRHIAPPKTGIELAEHHGKLDFKASDWAGYSDSQKSQALQQQYADLLSRADGSFPQTKQLTIPPPAPPIVKNQTGSVNPLVTADKLDQLPYLPDPLAIGASFIGFPLVFPGSTVLGIPGLSPGAVRKFSPVNGPQSGTLTPAGAKDTLVQVDYLTGTQWFDVKGFRIKLMDATGVGNTQPQWDSSNRVLTLYLAKADVATILYSSYTNLKGIEVMGVFQWIGEMSPLPPQNVIDYIGQLALEGRHWMVSPFRALTFVHAVQKPLKIPAFSNAFASSKYLGDTFATLTDSMSVDGKSTGKIDIRADWDDPVDDLTQPGPTVVKGSAHVFEQRINDPLVSTIATSNQHHFGDTKHRNVNYTAIGTTRFREYFPDTFAKNQSSITVQSPTPSELNILSSARPNAPDILYALPLFGWEPPVSNAKAMLQKRRGNALRIYMNRPWYSSGADERLGVLIWTDQFSKIPNQYEPYVTQWGMDPIWNGGKPKGAPSVDSFPLHKEWLPDVTLDELSTNSMSKMKELMIKTIPPITQTAKAANSLEQFAQTFNTKKSVAPLKQSMQAVSAQVRPANMAVYAPPNYVKFLPPAKPTLVVVGHEVQYDTDRQLWYCDIEIDAGATYTPFVRLALTRFQPNSVPDAFISRVVLADFMQLVPDRSAAVIFDPSNPKLVAVAVSGITYTNSVNKKPEGSEMEVSVEVARPDINDDSEELRWAPIPDATYQLVSKVNSDGTAVWSAIITLPEPRGSRKYRLHIREFERFPVLDSTNSESAAESARFTYIDPNQRRLVFANTFEI